MDYQEKLEKNMEAITRAYGNVTNSSGIYILTREENGFKFGYVGQAKHVKKRLAEHLGGYQHIDKSLIKHGFYAPDNLTGYALRVLECKEEDLDSTEQYYIRIYANAGYQLRNKTAGGQSEGKFNINDAREPKGYRDGIKQGEKIALRLISNFFDKYLEYSVKEPNNKVKERKINQFAKMLETKEI